MPRRTDPHDLDRNRILAAVERAGDAIVVDIADEGDVAVPLHLVHFASKGDWTSSPLIYAHRNGHGSMIARTVDDQWRLCRYWRDPADLDGAKLDFVRADAAELFPLISAGEQELLTLIPKTVADKPRLAVYREHILDVKWHRTEGFSLISDKAGTSEMFTGKLWENQTAVAWCQARLDSFRDVVGFNREREQAAIAQLAGPVGMRAHPMWGMF